MKQNEMKPAIHHVFFLSLGQEGKTSGLYKRARRLKLPKVMLERIWEVRWICLTRNRPSWNEKQNFTISFFKCYVYLLD
jgi:hypothetical protein